MSTSGIPQCNSDDIAEESSSLLCGLPDDIALLCLVRVPRRYHSVLAAVCKHWKELVCGLEFAKLRKQMRLSEAWLYVLSRDSSEVLHWQVLDPTRREWMEVPAMPGDASKRYGLCCEVLNRELYAIGGGERCKAPQAEVLKYNPATNDWQEAPSLETPRHFFASAVFEKKLYAVGGMGTNLESLGSYEVYDPTSQKWSIFYDGNIVSDLGDALVVNNLLYTRHVCSTIYAGAYASVYDPLKRVWKIVDNEITEAWRGPTAVTEEGEIYMLDPHSGFRLRLMKLHKASFCWDLVGTLFPRFLRPPLRMAVIKNVLYIIGRGLQIVTVDLDTTGLNSLWYNRGVIVTSSIPGLNCPDDVVVGCHALEV